MHPNMAWFEHLRPPSPGQDLIRLTIRSDPAGGWTARVGDSFGDRGKCEGQNIPPLECVIETRWPGVKVDWNGTEPIL